MSCQLLLWLLAYAFYDVALHLAFVTTTTQLLVLLLPPFIILFFLFLFFLIFRGIRQKKKKKKGDKNIGGKLRAHVYIMLFFSFYMLVV